ncbi:MAG: hypothetical protein ACXAEU_17195 [Candidatus Hodarchaeales archaeon]|jgi:DNA-directed RNA polymerase sigma subunit (sigma70/sigma32)
MLEPKDNPLAYFLSAKTQLRKESARSRAQKDFEHWNQWKNNGKKEEDMETLLKQMDPLIRKATNVYSGKVNLPPSAIRAEFQIQAIKAFDKYKPEKGAALGTYLTWQLKQGKRFITSYQNLGRIPETRVYKITEFNNEKDKLADEIGREPSALELADRLKWPMSQVSAMELELRKEVPSSTVAGDLTGTKPSKEAEVMRLLQYDLGNEERIVYEYLIGINGKQQLSPGQIAKKLKMTPSKVSRIKTKIGNKAERYY